MAVIIGTETTEVTRQRRTWRGEYFTELGAPYSARAHREIVALDANGNLVGNSERGIVVERKIDAAILAQTVTLQDGTVLTGAQVLEASAAFFDKWDEEDIAAAQPPPPPPEE